MDNIKSEHLKDVAEKIIAKLPISSLVLILGMCIGEFGLYKMYNSSSDGIERLISLVAFVGMILYIMVNAVRIYAKDLSIVVSYIKTSESDTSDSETTLE